MGHRMIAVHLCRRYSRQCESVQKTKFKSWEPDVCKEVKVLVYGTVVVFFFFLRASPTELLEVQVGVEVIIK